MSETEFKDEEGNNYEPRTGVIYIDTVSGTEKIYRWNKYEYVEISNTELLEGALNSHVQDKNNPHQVTKEQIGLSEVTNDAQVKRSEMGVAGGVATLDQEGKVPSSQLPSFVDDVIEVDSYDNLPTTGEAGKIYVTKDISALPLTSGEIFFIISPISFCDVGFTSSNTLSIISVSSSSDNCLGI
jgi:hypothetical protein